MCEFLQCFAVITCFDINGKKLVTIFAGERPPSQNVGARSDIMSINIAKILRHCESGCFQFCINNVVLIYQSAFPPFWPWHS